MHVVKVLRTAALHVYLFWYWMICEIMTYFSLNTLHWILRADHFHTIWNISHEMIKLSVLKDWLIARLTILPWCSPVTMVTIHCAGNREHSVFIDNTLNTPWQAEGKWVQKESEYTTTRSRITSAVKAQIHCMLQVGGLWGWMLYASFPAPIH